MRWTSRRKAEIVVEIEKGLITPEEAKRRYELSDEELAAWVRDYAAYGQVGLGVKQRRPRKRITKADRDHLSDLAIAAHFRRADYVQILAVKNRRAEKLSLPTTNDTRGGPMIGRTALILRGATLP